MYYWEENDDNGNETKEFLLRLREFRKYNPNNGRKYDNMNNLTLCSEYSEEVSEIDESKQKIKEEENSESNKIEKVKSKSITKIRKKNSMDDILNINYTKIALDEEKVTKISTNNEINFNSDLDTSNNIKNSKINISTKSNTKEANKKLIKTEVENKSTKSGDTKTRNSLNKNARKSKKYNFIGEIVNSNKERDNTINILGSMTKYSKIMTAYAKGNKDIITNISTTKTKTSPNNSEISIVKCTDKNHYGSRENIKHRFDNEKNSEISNEVNLKQKNEDPPE